MRYFDNTAQDGDDRVIVVSPAEYSVLRLALEYAGNGEVLSSPENRADAATMAEVLTRKGRQPVGRWETDGTLSAPTRERIAESTQRRVRSHSRAGEGLDMRDRSPGYLRD